MAVETERDAQLDPFRYRARRVVVTGAAHGVGAALLEVLAALDVGHVSVLDVETPSGPHDAFLATDLADQDSVSRALGHIEGPVHALFNNAGVADTQPPQTVLSVNYLAVRTLGEGLLDRMPEGGAIVNTASLAGNLWRKRAKQINEVLDLSVSEGWAASLRWFESNLPTLDQTPYNFSKELVEVYTLALVAHDHATRCTHEQRVPRARRYGVAPPLPQDDERQDHRLEHQGDERS